MTICLSKRSTWLVPSRTQSRKPNVWRCRAIPHLIPMAETLRLRVVTPQRLLLDEEIDEVTAPGTVGEFGVFPNHITFLSSLEPGRLTYKRGGQARTLEMSGGFTEVADHDRTVLAVR